MGTALFFHMTRSPVEVVVPTILTRALGRGWRVILRGTDPARIDWLDRRLWLGEADSFLPHGVRGGPHDALQPVLLTADAEPPPDDACLMTIDGAPVAAAECAGRERVWILFDGNDEAALATARRQWSDLTGAGVDAEYWSEATGKWELKTERKG